MEQRAYGNWRKPEAKGLFGLSWPATLVLIGGLVLMVLSTMFAGWKGGVVAILPVGGLLLATLKKDRHGNNLLDRLSRRSAFVRQSRSGGQLYRSGILGGTPGGRNQLPGLGSALAVDEYVDGFGRSFAMVYSPKQHSYTIVLAGAPQGDAMVDSDHFDQWVAAYGSWLAGLGDEPGVVGAQVIVETSPDPGYRLRTEVESHLDPSAPAYARAVLSELVETYPRGSSTVDVYVTVTFRATSIGGRSRSGGEMGVDLASRLPGLTKGLAACGAGSVRVVSARELAQIVRTAYDPAAAEVFARAIADGDLPALAWSEVGPVYAEARYDSFRHDSGVSASYVMSVAPRGNVSAKVLSRLLAPQALITRKRVSLVYRLHDPAAAALLVEKDLSTTSFALTATQKPSVRTKFEARKAEKTAAEEAMGAALVDFGMLVTITVAEEQDLLDAQASLDMVSSAARVRLRPAYGAQDSAFTANLPLGVILPDMVTGVQAMRSQL